MRVEVRLPQWGMGMTDGEIIRWMVEVGDQVIEGQPIAEVETAKVTEELPSPADGTVLELAAAVGDTIEVREVVAILEVSDA